jgi:hypothetical protein
LREWRKGGGRGGEEMGRLIVERPNSVASLVCKLDSSVNMEAVEMNVGVREVEEVA